MRSILIKILLLIVLAPFMALAQQTTSRDALLDRLAGKLVLRGTIDAQETTHDINASWVLGHQYLQIKEVSREKDTSGNASYEAIVYICWEQKLNQYSCLLLDNTGNGGLASQAVGHAKAKGDQLAFLFKGSDNSIFHTTFSYDTVSGTWQWSMDNEENGKLQPFARMSLTREP